MEINTREQLMRLTRAERRALFSRHFEQMAKEMERLAMACRQVSDALPRYVEAYGNAASQALRREL